jgi:hypothetical protein
MLVFTSLGIMLMPLLGMPLLRLIPFVEMSMLLARFLMISVAWTWCPGLRW